MAYIAYTAFETKISNAVFDETLNIAGKLQVSSADAICSAGFLCTRDSRAANAGYTNVNNVNSWNMIEAESSDTYQIPIYACNTFNVNEVTDPTNGAIRKVGANTLGLPLPAGVLGTFTRIEFEKGDRVYRFGVGNLSAALSTNTYFTIANGLLAPASSAPATAGTPYFTLVATGTFTQGASAAFAYVDVMALVA